MESRAAKNHPKNTQVPPPPPGLLLLGQKKKKNETKGLAIQGLENSLRTPLDILRTVED